jgi:transcriptional regulator with XRE-family HTH domain
MPRGDTRLRADNGEMNQVADRMRQRRRALKMTQERLCGRLADVTQSKWLADRQEIFRIEAGGRIVSDVELLALAAALECSPCWLLTGAETTDKSSDDKP